MEEENYHDLNKKPAIEFLNDVFNPQERLEKRLEAMEQEINQKVDSITKSIEILLHRFPIAENQMKSNCNLLGNKDVK